MKLTPHWPHCVANAVAVAEVAVDADVRVLTPGVVVVAGLAAVVDDATPGAVVDVALVADDAAATVEEDVCQPLFRDSSYHQFLSIQPSKSVITVEEPANMMKFVMPVGVQSSQEVSSRSCFSLHTKGSHLTID